MPDSKTGFTKHAKPCSISGMVIRSDLPDDVSALKAMVIQRDALIAEQHAQINRKTEEIAVKVAELARRETEIRFNTLLIEKLKFQLAKMRHDKFGSSSEALDQLELQIEELEVALARAAPDAATPETPTDRPARKPLPGHLPRREQTLSCGEACTRCGGALKGVGEDVTEELEYIPGRFVVNRIVRPRMACSCCETFCQAPLPSRPIERGRPGPGLLAHVLVSKYADHLPLYRQSQIYAREGVDLERSTLAGWSAKSAALLEPLAEAIARHVLAARAIHADDTPVDVLAPGNGKTKTGRLWAYVRDERPWGSDVPPTAFYRFTMDRKGEHPARHLANFSGFIHADGYAGFNEIFRTNAVTEVACLAHIRRKFFDIARLQGASVAAEAVQRIAMLYAIEDEARGKPPDVRAAIRQAKAKPVLEDLIRWMESERPKLSARSDTAGAMRYALKRLPKLEVYLCDGRLEIDNNAAERSIRGIALGKKNWLFAGSEGGGRTAAILYTLIETAKLNQIDPQAWLTFVLGRIADQKITRLDELLPWNYAAPAA